MPFEDILLPFVAHARSRLAARAGVEYALLCAAAHAALERDLLQRLSKRCQPVLLASFAAYRRKHRLFGFTADDSRTDTRLYQAFVTRLLADGLRKLFLTYPVLARLVATCIGQWVTNFSTFLARVGADTVDLQATFDPQHKPGNVVSLRPGLSDPHHGGQTVLDLKFAGGLRVIYKPRSLAAEEVFYDLLEWFNKTTDFDFRTVAILDRSEYG